MHVLEYSPPEIVLLKQMAELAHRGFIRHICLTYWFFGTNQ